MHFVLRSVQPEPVVLVDVYKRQTIGNMNCKEFFEKNKKFLSEVLSDFVSDTMERRYKTIVSHIEKGQYWEYNR